MSLIGALNIGKTALATQQAALQVTGNNIANAGDPNYTRQVTTTAPAADSQLAPGIFVGNGVDLTGIERQIDESLQGRLRSAASDSASADGTQEWVSRVEAVFNELGDQDLSTQLSKFFNAWSDLANKPQDMGLRQIVVQSGTAVASWVQNLRSDLGNLQTDADSRLAAQTKDADGLLQQVADLNAQISVAQGGTGGVANGLADQRDAVLGKLAQLMDVKTVPGDNGMVNVYVGSQPVVFGATNRGVTTRTDNINGKLVTSVICKADNGRLDVTGGQLGSLLSVRQKYIDGSADGLDALAGNLIFELNKAYSGGQGLQGFSGVSSTNAVDDPTLALNDPKAGLGFTPTNGSFVVHVKDKTTGLETSTLVQVDLDGLNGNDTTLNSLSATLGGIAGVSSSVSGGKLTISAANPNLELSFSQDSSGALAALGVNSFFTGEDARDIAVNQVVVNNPALLAASKNGQPGDNQTALAISGLESKPLGGLGGVSLKDSYQAMVNGLGTAGASAKNEAEAAKTVQDTLTAQRESLSGVSLDEEAVNLMRQQRAFQGAARLISAVDELMKTVLQLT